MKLPRSVRSKRSVVMRTLWYLAVLPLATALAFAQVREWRPQLSEDNKSASWDDTSAFLVSVLRSKSKTPMQAESSRRCVIEETVQHGSKTKIYHYDLGGIDALTISVTTPSDGSLSIVSFAGTAYRAYGKLTIVDRDPQQGVSTAIGPCSSSENRCKETVSELVEPDFSEFVDEESAKRFARALMHAALLCGGTKSVSPF